jgi:hypothetical protein
MKRERLGREWQFTTNRPQLYPGARQDGQIRHIRIDDKIAADWNEICFCVRRKSYDRSNPFKDRAVD